MSKPKINTVHCMFEQSGTFKKEFQKLGYNAYDYDIQNEFGETDYQIDLFAEIEKAWVNEPSIFDNITTDDLIMAFFPCIYFESMQQTYFSLDCINYRGLNKQQMYDVLVKRIADREYFYTKLWKLYAVCDIRGLKLIIENPATVPHYLLFTQNFVKPTFIDKNRALRGDYYVKPTAYWFLNIKPTHGKSFCINPNPKNIKSCKPAPSGGVCSKERSLLSPTYARNFICDFILGKTNEYTEPTLFGD